MAQAKLADLLELQAPEGYTKDVLKELQLAIEKLNPEYGNIYSAEGFKGSYYSFANYSELKTHLRSLGFPENTPDKYYGLVIANWYENATPIPDYSEASVAEASRPDGLNRTTVTEKGDEGIFTAAAERLKQGKEAADKGTKRAKDFLDRQKEIHDEQQKLKVQIDKLKASQKDLEGKKVFANLTMPEPPFLDKDEQAAYDTLKKFAEADPIELVNQFSEKIESLIKEELKTLPPEEIKLIARYHAAVIVEKISKPESLNTELPKISQIAILSTIINDTSIVPSTIKSKAAHESMLHASKVLYNTKANNLFSRSLSVVVMGPKFTSVAFGPGLEEIKVQLSNIKTENSIPVDFGAINTDATIKEETHYQALDSFRDITIGQANTYVFSITSKAVESKIASLPANSKLKAIYDIPGVKGILSKYGLASSVEWQAYTKFGSSVLKYYPEASPYLSLFGQITGISVGIGVASKVVPLTFGAGIPSVITAIQPIKWAGAPYTYGIATGKAFTLKVAGQAATQTGAKVGFAGFIAKVAAFIGLPAGPVGVAISTAIFAGITAIAKKINWPKVRKWFEENGAVFAIGGGLAGSLLFGAGPGVGIGLALGGATVGFGTLFTGALGVLGFIGRSIGLAIATPIIITLLVLPPLIAFIMLVINNSAYVVPPSPFSSRLSQDNPYMTVEKKADPEKIPNPNGRVTVTYTVTITALQNTLTNLQVVSSECNVVKKDNSTKSCPDENIPQIEQSASASPTSPYTFTFTSDYDSSFSDLLIYDSIEISADTLEQTGVTTSGSATLCIGDCPTDCVNADDPSWSANTSLQANLRSAIASLSGGHPDFMRKVCAQGKPINMCYTTTDPSPVGDGLCNNTIYARHLHTNNCDVNFNQCGIRSVSDASFLLTHELTHHVQKINGGSIDEYRSSGGFNELAGRGFCSYSATQSDIYEAMAEANGLFVSIPSWGTCASNYRGLYPRNYVFAERFVGR